MNKAKTTALLLLSILFLSSVCDAKNAMSNSGAGQAIIDRTNELVCNLVTLLLYVVGGVAALAIILGGIRYMTSDNPVETSRAKTMIEYAVIGLIIAIIACPVIDYMVTNTEILPFENSCPCLVMGPGATTTTTIPGQPCVDGTPLGQCSLVTAGMRCVANTGTGGSVLVADASCNAPATTTSTTGISTTTTIAKTTDQTICQNAQAAGKIFCDGLNLINSGYKQDCCTDWGFCCCPAYC